MFRYKKILVIIFVLKTTMKVARNPSNNNKNPHCFFPLHTIDHTTFIYQTSFNSPDIKMLTNRTLETCRTSPGHLITCLFEKKVLSTLLCHNSQKKM